NHGRIGVGFGDGFAAGVEHRYAQILLAAAAGRDATDELCAVGLALFGMETALAAGNALANDFRVVVDENAHKSCPCVRVTLCSRNRKPALQARAAATTFSAASVKPCAAMISKSLSSSILLPCSAFVPSRRTTTGISSPTCLTAWI